jgi:predicted acylesterase/phospholipase RssA
MKPRPEVYGCIGGGGPGITYLAGAAAALDATCEVRGWSGASAGALLAVGKAFGVPDEDIALAIKRALGSGALLQADPMALSRGGVLKWEVVGDIVDRLIGRNQRMKDATAGLVICVTNLDLRRPLYISKIDHPGVRVREAVMASSAFMAMVTPACRITSLGAGFSPDVRLFVDGGWTDNTVDSVWDGQDAPRALLRLKPDDNVKRVREGSITDIHGAVLQSALWAASLPKSHRADGVVVDVDGRNDWSFIKDADRCDAEWNRGYDSTRAQLETWMMPT